MMFPRTGKKRGTVLPAVLLCAAALAVLSACGGGSGQAAGDGQTAGGGSVQTEGENRTAEDGQSADASQPAGGYTSVVALSKSIGDLWLLAGGSLSGITEDGLELEGTENTVSVGTISKPNEEAVLSLAPDLVLLSGELSAHQELKQKLDLLGIQTISVTVDSFQDYGDIMADFTQMTGHPERFEQYVTDVEEEIEEVKSRVPGETKGTYLAIRASATKNKALKNDYFACAIFNDLGLENVVSDTSDLDELNMEWIVGAAPDNIFIVLGGEETEALESLEKSFSGQPVWKDLPAVQNGKVFVLPKDLFQYKPNAAWAEAYEYAYGLIYGEE